MKKRFTLYLLLLIPFALSAQESAQKKNNLEIQSSLVVDQLVNARGGMSTGAVTMALFDFQADYRPFSKGKLQNLSLFAHLQKSGGKGASEKYIGDAQVVSNIEGKTSRFFYELYLKHQFKNLSVLFGFHDLNSEFMMSDYAGDFINSSFGILPTVSLNHSVSIYPVTTLGGVFTYQTKNFDVATGIYNLNEDFVNEEEFHFSNHLFKKGYLAVLEFRYKTNSENGWNGTYRIGGFYKDDKHQIKDRNHGFYLIADQDLWKFPNDYRLGMFTQLGITPKSSNAAPNYYGAGISLKTTDQKYFPDLIGLAIGSVGLNSFTNTLELSNTQHETAIELCIKKEISPRISLQPDIQYVIHPSGIYKNALVGIIRLEINLK